jgi:hypothetical protein
MVCKTEGYDTLNFGFASAGLKIDGSKTFYCRHVIIRLDGGLALKRNSAETLDFKVCEVGDTLSIFFHILISQKPAPLVPFFSSPVSQ